MFNEFFTLFQIKLENGVRIRKLSVKCSEAQKCCQLQCCDPTYETFYDDGEKEGKDYSRGIR